MASAGCNFTKTAGPFYDEIAGKKVYHGRMAFQSTAGYDQADLPRVFGGDAGFRPQDVFDGANYIDHLVLHGDGSEADNNQANQAGQGTGCAVAEFLPDTQRVRLWNKGNFFNATVQARNEVEMATDVAAPYPLTSMVFECKVIIGA